MKRIEVTGISYEEALSKALEELNTTEDKIEIIEKKETGLIRKKVTLIVEEKVSTEKIINDFINGVIEKLSLDCTASVKETDDTFLIQLSGKDTGILIGYRGEVLDSLQYLTLLIANKDGHLTKRLVIDGENYREKRQITLSKLAKKLAFQASKSGKDVKLEPMNPFERRIIHSALVEDKYVTTESEGEEPNRYVVIKPTKRSFDKNRKTYNKPVSKETSSSVSTEPAAPRNFEKTGFGNMKSFGGEKKRLF